MARRVRRLAMLSLHTSPLAQPGVGDSGGMNVYVRELVSALAQAGVDCTTYVRRWSDGLPDEVVVEPGFRVVHVDAGPPDLPKEALPDIVEPFADGAMEHLAASGGVDVVHANYWLSGLAGLRIKHELDLPLVTTFHTLARVKAENGDAEPQRRERPRPRSSACADAICVSCTEEARQLRRLYGESPAGSRSSPPASTTPSSRPATGAGRDGRSASATTRCCCSSDGSSRSRASTSRCGRWPSCDRPDAVLVVVGGASGVPAGTRWRSSAGSSTSSA